MEIVTEIVMEMEIKIPNYDNITDDEICRTVERLASHILSRKKKNVVN